MRVNIYDLEFDENRLPTLIATKRIDCDNKVADSKTAFEIFERAFNASDLVEEHLMMLALDTEGKPIGVFECSHGTMLSTPMCFRNIFQRLLCVNAVQFIIAHNHPSGDINPSEEDAKNTCDLINFCGPLGIIMLDAFIISKRKYESYVDD